MVDVIFFALSLLTVLAVMVRRTSAGVAVLALLAGVLLEQLLAGWILGELPETVATPSQYMPLAVRLFVMLSPVAASLLVVKAPKQNTVLSLLTSLLLGFLITYFGLQVLQGVPHIADATSKSGLLSFVAPYQNQILAASAVFAVFEMIVSHHTAVSYSKKKKKKD